MDSVSAVKRKQALPITAVGPRDEGPRSVRRHIPFRPARACRPLLRLPLPGSAAGMPARVHGWEAAWREGRTPWDKGAAAPPLREVLRRHRPSGPVLVPGSGSGHDIELLLGAGPGLRVIGLDLAPSAVVLARRRFGPRGAHVLRGDLLRMPAGWRGRFETVVEHTCFCALKPTQRRAYVRAVAALLPPGGYLLGVFFLEPKAEQGPPFGVSRDALHRLFQGRFALKASWTPRRAYPGREEREEVRLYRRR